jgi:hypothetical protein
LYAFFEEKCILDLFLYKLEKLRLQPARNQQFAHGSKKRHLYDSVEIRGFAIFSFLIRNMMMVKEFRAKSVFRKNVQIRVNNMYTTFAKGEITRF